MPKRGNTSPAPAGRPRKTPRAGAAAAEVADEHEEAEAMEPEAVQGNSKGKGTGDNPTCSLCKKREKTWAAYAIKKKSGRPAAGAEPPKRPIEDRCLDCFKFWDANLQQFMTWEQLCAKAHDENDALSKEWEGGIAVQQKKNEQSFTPSDVFSSQRTGIRVFEQGFFLSPTEFKHFTGGLTPEMCGVKAVEGANLEGKVVRGYLIKDESRPFRTYQAYGDFGETLNTHRLDASAQVFASQAGIALDFWQKKRSSGGNGPKNILGCKAYTLEELRERAKGRSLAGGAGDGGDGGRLGAASSDDDGPSDEEVVERAAATAMDLTTPVGKRRGKKAAASSVGGAVPSPGALGDGVSTVGGGTSYALDDDDDAQGQRNQPWTHWVSVLNLQKLLQGDKMGKQKHFANRAIERLLPRDKNAVFQLRAHLKLVALCETLAVPNIPQLTDQELEGSLNMLIEHKIEMPTVFKQALLKRRVGKVLQQATSGDMGATKVLVDITVPWGCDGDFDPLAPTSAAIEGSLPEKCSYCVRVLMKDFTLQLFLEEASGSQVLGPATGFLAEYMQSNTPADDEDSIDIDTMAFEMVQVWKAIHAMLTPSFFYNDAGTDLDTIETAESKSIPGLFKAAMRESEYWAKLQADLRRSLPHIRTHGAIIQKFTHPSGIGALLPDESGVTVARKHIEDFVLARAHLREGACGLAEMRLETYICDFVESVLDKKPVCSVALAVDSLLVGACRAFPASGKLQALSAKVADIAKSQNVDARFEALVVSLESAISSMGDPDKRAEVKRALSDAISASNGLQKGADKHDQFDKLDKLITIGVGKVGAFGEKGDMESCAALTDALKQLLDFLSLPSLEGKQKTIAAWHCLHDLKGAIAEFSGLGLNTQECLKKDKGFLTLKGIISKRLRMESVMKSVGELDDGPLKKFWNATAQSAKTFVEEAGKTQVSDDSKKLLEHVGALESLLGGAPNGEKWMVGAMTTEDWDAMKAAAAETLLKLGTVLDERIASVQKAWDGARKTSELFGVSVEDGLGEKAEKSIVDGQVIQILVGVFAAIKNHGSDKVRLRRTMAKQVAAARTGQVTPEMLPPLAWSKMNAAVNFESV